MVNSPGDSISGADDQAEKPGRFFLGPRFPARPATVVSQDRSFPERDPTHAADIDYETVITYTGGYDMVLAKTQIRPN